MELPIKCYMVINPLAYPGDPVIKKLSWGLMSSKVDIKLDLSKFGETLASEMAYRTALTVKAFAIRKVAVDTGELKSTIQVSPLSSGNENYSVFSDSDHAAPQELGRPDIPNYRFTPFLRPAATEALSQGNYSANFAESLKAAQIKGKL